MLFGVSYNRDQDCRYYLTLLEGEYNILIIHQSREKALRNLVYSHGSSMADPFDHLDQVV